MDAKVIAFHRLAAVATSVSLSTTWQLGCGGYECIRLIRLVVEVCGFTAIARTDGSPYVQIDAVGNKSYGSIAHRYVDATGVSAASADDRMFARCIGNRAASTAVDCDPVGRRDVVVHRARIKSERPTVREVAALQPAPGRIEIETAIQIGSLSQAARKQHICIDQARGRLSKLVMSEGLGRVVARLLPVPLVRSEKNAVLDRPSEIEATVRAEPIVNAPLPRRMESLAQKWR